MNTEHEFGTKSRLLRVMITLLEQPNQYTMQQLADRFSVSKDTIKKDFIQFRNVGFIVEYDNNYRYTFKINKPYKKLKELLHFSEEDQLLLTQAIDQIGKHNKRSERLKKKLASLYDYRKLGHSYLRKPYLNKVDLLEQAKANQVAVILEGYRSSNSNDIRNRMVEPFHISPPEDSIHAFDIEKGALRHFRISRVKRIKLTDTPWRNTGKHYIRQTDPFRIVNDEQVRVHIRFKVGAYNELIERFPLTEPFIEHDMEEDIYDFECKVNSRFFGLTNFILGFHHQMVEIIEPESLLLHIQSELKEIQKKIGLG